MNRYLINTAVLPVILAPEVPGHLTKVSGIIQVVERKIETTGGAVLKRIPVAPTASLINCELQLGSLVDMVPNSKNAGMVYFEDKGLKPAPRRSSSVTFYKSDIRLVCWLNTKLLPVGVTAQDVFSDLHRRVTQIRQNAVGDLRVVTAIFTGSQRNESVFAEFDYDESQTQYLMPPYDFFAMDFEFTFGVPRGCNVVTGPAQNPLC